MSLSFGACLLLSWILFGIGLMVLLGRRNLLTLVFAILLMFQGTALGWVAGWRFHGDALGSLGLIVLLVAMTAQFLIGLGLVVRIAKDQSSVDVSKQNFLKN